MRHAVLAPFFPLRRSCAAAALVLALGAACTDQIHHQREVDGGVPALACGGAPFPDGALTGPGATALTAYQGPSRIVSPGTVIESAELSGCLTIAAANVIVRRSRIRTSQRCTGAMVSVEAAGAGVLLEDVELDGLTGGGRGIAGSGYTASRVEVHSVNNAFNVDGSSPTVIEASWAHSLSEGGGTSSDAFITNGGSHVVLRGNNLESQYAVASVIALYGDFAQIDDILIERNLLNGGGYALYGGYHPGKPYPNATAVRVVDNCFGRALFPRSGYFGPVSAYDGSGAGNSWTGNRWQDTGEAVQP